MKNRIIKIGSVLVVLALLAQGIFCVSQVLEPIFIGDVYNTIDAFYQQPDNSMDVMIYGSSHAWKGFDAAELSKNYQVSAWNYGGNWQNVSTTELFLEDSLLSQSPKVVLIESYLINSVYINTKLNGEIMYTNHLRWSDAKQRYIQQAFGDQQDEYFAYFFPLAYYHTNWNSLEQWSFQNPTDAYDFVAGKGYLASDAVAPVTIPDYRKAKQEQLSPEATATLDRIVKTCKDRGIEIVFYVVPWEGEFAYREALSAYAEENGCHYVDFFEKAEDARLDGATDFQDTGHLNDSGAKKVANYMGQYLYEHFGIGEPARETAG